MSSSTSAHPCHRFSLVEIQSATKNFDDEMVIGKGGFGKVYKAQISIEETDHVVAVKRLDSMSNQGAPEFRAEIEMLSMLRHCHLVSLIGYCDDNKEMILVYEYMPHGTLYYHLHKAERDPLSWVQRLRIAIGAGRGLDYLHTGVGTQLGVIHRDVKSSNILLDENWEAMIADFGLSKIGPTNQSSSYFVASVKGTFGYLDPDYFYTGKVTRKTDVYAFGVVLFELLSGRLAVDERRDDEECSLVRWVQKCMKERKLDQMVDANVRGTLSTKCLKGFTHIAYRCLHGVPKERPTMTDVVASLQAILKLQENFEKSTKSSNTGGFTWRIHKYFVLAHNNNSDQTTTSSPKNLENNMKQCSLTDEGDSNNGEVRRQCGDVVTGDLRLFTYVELACATRDFRDCVGKDRFGEVYKGWVNKNTYSPSNHSSTGLHISIRRLHGYKYEGFEKLESDLIMLKEFSHPNIASLKGYCFEQEELFLVYEFMHKGNFVDHLKSGVIGRLPLVTKVKIAIGIARGITFLLQTQDEFERLPYTETLTGILSETVLERDKILLDKDFTAKLSAYDITTLLHAFVMFDDYDTCYYYPGLRPIRQLQTDLSGFTVVFTEVLTGKSIDCDGKLWSINRFMSKYGKEPLRDIARLCFHICNEVDSESRIMTILEDYDKLIRSRLESWLRAPWSS